MWICSHPDAHDIISRFNYSNIMIIIELSHRAPLAYHHDGHGTAVTLEGSVEGKPAELQTGFLTPFHFSLLPFHAFLTGTPKQLEIAVNHRKQDTEVVSNRHKNATLAEANQDVRSGRPCNRSAGGISGFRSPMDSTGVLGSDLPTIFRAITVPELRWQYAAPRRTGGAFLIETPKRLETPAT
jgi:hypothetical protein